MYETHSSCPAKIPKAGDHPGGQGIVNIRPIAALGKFKIEHIAAIRHLHRAKDKTARAMGLCGSSIV